MKDLIISAYTKYHFNFLKAWVLSLRETGFAGDIVVLALDGDEETNTALETHGVKVVRVNDQLKNYSIVVSRFLYYYDYLRNNPNYRYVLTADMRDVIFQRNPSDYMEKVLGAGDKHIIAAGETRRLKHHKWNADNFAQFFGNYLLGHVADKEIRNAGVIAGTCEYMKGLFLHIFYMCQHTPKWGPDQAAMQLFFNHQPWQGVTHYPTLNEAWVLNATATNSTVTGDPPVPPEQWLHSPPLAPYMEDGVVKNGEGEPFAIVHLYDRVRPWLEYYYTKYQVPYTIR